MHYCLGEYFTPTIQTLHIWIYSWVLNAKTHWITHCTQNELIHSIYDIWPQQKSNWILGVCMCSPSYVYFSEKLILGERERERKKKGNDVSNILASIKMLNTYTSIENFWTISVELNGYILNVIKWMWIKRPKVFFI